MKTNHPKSNWFIDVILFAGFLAACWLELTGVELHQWLGMAIGAFALYHLFAHRAWVKNVAARFFTTTSNQARMFMLLDATLLLGFGLILLTGLVISTWLGLALGNYAAWSFLHTLTSFGTLGLVILKIGLHWRWIVNVIKRYIVRPVTVAPSMLIAQPVAATNSVSRREFIKLMGVVGAVSLLPALNALEALAQGGVQLAAGSGAVARTTVVTPTTTRSPNATTSTNLPTNTNTTTTNACTVRCRKACSYPGQCRKYVDSNHNQRCDLGECV